VHPHRVLALRIFCAIVSRIVRFDAAGIRGRIDIFLDPVAQDMTRAGPFDERSSAEEIDP